MPPRSLNRREYGEFKQMLEQALLEVRLPAGIVDTNNIVPGAIRPNNCKLDAAWNFRGTLSAGGTVLNNLSTKKEAPDEAAINAAATATATETTTVGDEDIFFLNALKRKVLLTLPRASKNLGRKIYVKRVDSDASMICRIETTGNDKIDDDDRITLTARQGFILIASSDRWHIFAKYAP